MIRSKSRKNKSKAFNIIEVVIVAIVALMLFYIVYVSILGNSLADLALKKMDVQYTLTVENANYVGFLTLSEGEAVLSKDGKTELGKIVSLKFYDAGNGYGTAEITVYAKGFYQKGELYNEFKKYDTAVILGEEVSVRFAEYSPTSGVKCTNIKVK